MAGMQVGLFDLGRALIFPYNSLVWVTILKLCTLMHSFDLAQHTVEINSRKPSFNATFTLNLPLAPSASMCALFVL